MNQKPQRIVAVSRIKDRRGRGGNGVAPRYTAVAARTWKAEGDTKDGATQALRDQLANAHRHAATMTVVFCGDGTVATIRYSIDVWEYRLHRPGQAVASSCLGNWTTEEQVLEEVVRLAGSGFGGVLHISR